MTIGLHLKNWIVRRCIGEKSIHVVDVVNIWLWQIGLRLIKNQLILLQNLNWKFVDREFCGKKKVSIYGNSSSKSNIGIQRMLESISSMDAVFYFAFDLFAFVHSIFELVSVCIYVSLHRSVRWWKLKNNLCRSMDAFMSTMCLGTRRYIYVFRPHHLLLLIFTIAFGIRFPWCHDEILLLYVSHASWSSAI